MTAPAAEGREQLLELLADRATQGLGEEEERDVERLLARHPEVDPFELEMVAAAVDLAVSPPPAEPVPDDLQQRLERDGLAFCRESGRPWGPPVRARTPRTRPPRPVRRALSGLGWVAAAALALVLLARADLLPVPFGGAPRSAAERRERLLADASDAVVVPWTATEDPASSGPGGDVVWSPSRQEGYMRFSGLAANDPTQRQYQLWIFDATRDERHPVNGGVFDVPPAEGDVVVPIRARLPVEKATLFAVTVERPGGVVVSSRERLPLLAKVEG